MCCNTGHNINLVASHPGRPYGPYQITILRHQVHTMVIMVINILNILISSMMMMMMKSGGFSYGGFSYILCSYILRSYFGCTPVGGWVSRCPCFSNCSIAIARQAASALASIRETARGRHSSTIFSAPL